MRMEPIDRFATNYLELWERHATVRSTKRYALAPDMGDVALYPERLQPFCNMPEVRELGSDARQFILVQSCYRFMNEIALLEVDFVTRLATDLANRSHRVTLPRSVRQVALTVTVDETYHAFAAREFMAQVENATGIQPIALQPRCSLDDALDAAERAAPDEIKGDLHVLALCIAEHSVTAEIFGMVEETVPENPFHIVSAEHLLDERRHQGFFQHVLKHYWAGLEAPLQEALGALLPEFLQRFLEGYDWLGHSRMLLQAVGLDAGTVEELARPFSRTRPRYLNPMAQNVMRLLTRSGVLDRPSIYAVLAGEGWVAPASEAGGES